MTAQDVERVNRRPASDSRGVVTDSSPANSTGPRSTPFVLVTASRDEGFISAVIAEDEWQKLFELAEALPNNLVWTAQAHEGASHKSQSTPQ